MKKLLFLLMFLLSGSLSFAQMPNQMMQEFNAKHMAGVLKYKKEKVFKKTGIKEDSKKQAFSEGISEYNKAIDKIIFMNTPKFEEVDRKVRAQREIAMANKDRQEMIIVMQEARDELAPVKNQVIEETKKLNEKAEKILSAKQNKKWLKYQKSKKEALKPKRPSGQPGGMSKGQGRGNGGGMGNMRRY